MATAKTQEPTKAVEASRRVIPIPTVYTQHSFLRPNMYTIRPDPTVQPALPIFTVIRDKWFDEVLVIRSEKPLDLKSIKESMGSLRNKLFGKPCLRARDLVPADSIIASIRFEYSGAVIKHPHTVVTFYHKDRRGRPDRTDRVLLEELKSVRERMWSIDMPMEAKLGTIYLTNATSSSFFRPVLEWRTQEERVLVRWDRKLIFEGENIDDELLGWLVTVWVAMLND